MTLTSKLNPTQKIKLLEPSLNYATKSSPFLLSKALGNSSSRQENMCMKQLQTNGMPGHCCSSINPMQRTFVATTSYLMALPYSSFSVKQTRILAFTRASLMLCAFLLVARKSSVKGLGPLLPSSACFMIITLPRQVIAGYFRRFCRGYC